MRECDNRVSLLRKFATRSIVHPPSSLRCSIVRLRFVTSGDLAVNWKSLFPRFWNLSRPARSIIQEPVTKLDGNMKLPSKSSQSQTSLKTGADFHPAYSEILEGINNKLLNSESSVSNRADIVNKVVYDLLQHGEEWNKFRRTSLKKKIDHCILLDNFVPNVGVSMDARAKALQSHSKRSQKHMSRQQHRKCGSFDMPKEFHKFELFKPMHDMWKAYILELLEESNKKQLAQCLLTADLHGAFVVVVDCKTRSFVGMSGIMIRETAETFGIIKRDNHFRVVPKRGSVFVFQAGCWKVTLHGDKLSLRNIT